MRKVFFVSSVAGAFIASAQPVCAETVIIDTINVVAGRLPTFGDRSLSSRFGESIAAKLGGEELDHYLTRSPGVSLFRRSDSLTAHPTIQGISLMPVGASGAGRSLVTLDGIPLNDPFGGWVYWSALDMNDLHRGSLRPAKAGGSFASYSLTGRVELHSLEIENDLRLSGSIGSYDSRHVGGRLAQKFGPWGVKLSSQYRKTDGYHQFSPDQRGPIDVPLSSDQTSVSAALIYGEQDSDGEQTGFSAHIGGLYFKENRLNGFITAPNSTAVQEITSRMAYSTDDWGVELLGWYKDRAFQNIFTAALNERTAERPVLDQFSVPAWSAGGALRFRFKSLEVGLDMNRVQGSVQENFRNLGAGFTRLRRAGGDQSIIGAYVQSVFDADDLDLSVTVDGRLDHYAVFNGQRRESDLATSNLLFEESYDRLSGTVPTGGVSLSYTPFLIDFDDVALTLSYAHSWRLPTLNEYYRPFRVGNDITEANGTLRPEKLATLSAAFQATWWETSLKATYRHLRHQDGVGNITLGAGPGFFPVAGFVPAGGVLRQRTNIDQLVVDSAEITLSHRLDDFNLMVTYHYTDARITAFKAMPTLIGKRPVQTPAHRGLIEARYDPGFDFWVSLQGDYLGRQFDDDLNSRVLPAVFLMHFAAAYDLSERVTLALSATNIFDTKVISALSGDGLETVAQRRQVKLTATYKF